MTQPGSRPYVWMLSGTFSFTLMVELAFELTQVSRSCDWQTVAIARSSLVALFAGLMAWAAGARLVFLRPARLWVRSVAGSCSMVCTFYSFGHLPAVDVVTLTNTFPIWVAVLSWPIYGKPPGWRMGIAVLIGVAGVALVEQPQFEAGNLGVVTALFAALFSAVAMLGLHSLRGVDPRAIVVHFSVVAMAFCFAAFLAFPRSVDVGRIAEPMTLAKLLALGVSATVGQILLTLAFGSGAPAKVSVVGLMQIVIALGFDIWLWHRQVNAATVVGTLLVIAPTAWLLTRPAAVDRHDPDPGEPEPIAAPIDRWMAEPKRAES
ncbi:MAG TPA: DMT family transporter [Gemmataceae bacterium]|jgi:drug/metabolite transporter (DMT)-like permease